MILTFADASTITLPDTLLKRRLEGNLNYVPTRAPFSSVQVLSGDGLPLAEPFEIVGKAYFSSTDEANNWVSDLRGKLGTVSRITLDTDIIDLHAADLIILPQLLPRVLSVRMKCYPKSSFVGWPTGLVHEYRFDEGSGSTVTDYVGGANGTCFGTGWGTPGAYFTAADGEYISITGLAPTLQSDSWTQVIAYYSGSISHSDAGLLGTTDATDFSGKITRVGTGTSLRYVAGSDAHVGEIDAFSQNSRILHVSRNGLGSSYGITPTTTQAGPGSVGPGTVVNTLTLGRSGTSYLDAILFYYVVFNRTLTQSELTRVYNKIKAITEPRGVSL